jgi:hypothetical protein
MKQKLKILFAQFRGVSQSLETTILMDRDRIEDWDQIFVTYEGSSLSMTTSIENILKELIDLYYSQIRGYLNFDIDEYWYLQIDINPSKKTLVFTATCKEEQEIRFTRDYEYTDLDSERQGLVDYLYSEFPDSAKIEFEGYGRWDDSSVSEFYVDGMRKRNIEDYDELWDIANYFMSKINGTWWNSDAGASYDITIWGDDIFVRGYKYEQEYEDTGMTIKVTPDDVLENDEE